MDDSPLLKLEGIGKRFGYRWALRDVSLEVPRGTFMLLLGNNGAGKSTLLRVLSTLMRPSAGSLHFEGQAVKDQSARMRRQIGMISHDSRLYPDLTAVENLRIFGTLYGVGGLRARIPQVLEQVRLSEAADIPTRAFSSGMLKRLNIGRLLLSQPSLLLLDEPHSGLDQASIALLDDYLRDFRAGGGTTVMVTHQFTGGVGLSDRIVILQQGRLVYNQAESGVTAAHCAELLQAYPAPVE